MKRERRHQTQARKGKEIADTEEAPEEEAGTALGEKGFGHHFTGKKLS